MILDSATDAQGREIKGITDTDGTIGFLEPRAVSDVLVKIAGVSK